MDEGVLEGECIWKGICLRQDLFEYDGSGGGCS